VPPRPARIEARRRAGIALRLAAPCALAAAASTGLAVACSAEIDVAPVAPDAAGDEGSVSPDDCPTAVPVTGASCALPDGTTCDFGQCGTRLARCTRGVWQVGANAPPSPPCPADPPSADVGCPACWPAAVVCTYGSTSCAAPDASLNTAVASCPAGTWVIDIRPCRDGGGPDVQGDAGPDAD
jgi:hypothetical protein